jgi:hypothetical protein
MFSQRAILVLFASLSLLAGSVAADVPRLVNFQGVLTDDSDQALQGTYSVTFSVYADSTGGSALWSETLGVDCQDGLFDVTLGHQVYLGLDFSEQYWIGIRVAGDDEMLPRYRVSSVPYSLYTAVADSVARVNWNSISGLPSGFADGIDDISGAPSEGWADDGNVVRLVTEGDTVGIGTASPAAKLDVRGTLNVGLDGLGHDVNFYGQPPTYGRLFWNASNSAVRAGSEEGTSWHPDSVGIYSAAFGCNVKAGGDFSAALGNYTRAEGSFSTAFGNNSRTPGDFSVAGGNYCVGQGMMSTAFGDYAKAFGGRSLAAGFYSTAMGDGSVALGWEAASQGTSSVAIGRHVTAGADHSFVLGRGIGYGDSLVNNIDNSLMVGFNTTQPTLFVGGPNHRVGIGLSDPEAMLEVDREIRCREYQTWSPWGGLWINSRWDQGDFRHEYINDGYALVIQQDAIDGGLIVRIAKSGTSGSALNGVEAMIIDTLGNVGIGTSTPSYLLDVADTAQMLGFKMPAGATDGYVLTSDASGAGTWQPAAGGGGAWTVSGGNLYSALPGSVGIGTSNPAAKLDVQGTFNVGVDSSGYNVTFYGHNPGSRLHWNQWRNAFRAGIATGGEWDDVNTGFYSTATGYNTEASGQYSVSLGAYNDATGWASNALGYGVSADGDHSFAIGRFVTVDSDTSIVMGSGVSGLAQLVNSTPRSLAVGFNTTSPTLFVGGPDHRVGIGTTTPDAKLAVQGTVTVGADGDGYDVVFYGSSSGSKVLWNKTRRAFRAGGASGDEWNEANLGNHSFATGANTTASQWYSTAMGVNTTASGVTSTALGAHTTAGGDYSLVAGEFSIADGHNSVALGKYVTASAGSSFVIGGGFDNGNRIENSSPSSLMVGFNSDLPTLFVGPGSGIGTTGKVGVGTSTPARSLHVSDVVRLEPRASAPDSAAMGDMYVRSSDGKLLVYDGSLWQECW